ncbi:hypothetical protein M427DRAFT_63902 [Gonapodya prolifera JEL478]|uniref:F-box domain-containing protein n=1 Tax=Gonapodya prolifera (strain JEL478) TaxID=1344416 RepID=A0A138ZYH7_GONPJ|nr:hypothetical protein M427DRAFT_63902 [Gonapodya prolifera JEL478]|eukprot:KXS09521.1 hypothetical protein M427DRAFT_63902 [Gonapodya prolifera JEL478]
MPCHSALSSPCFPLLNLPDELIARIGRYMHEHRLALPTESLNRRLKSLLEQPEDVSVRALHHYKYPIDAVFDEAARGDTQVIVLLVQHYLSAVSNDPIARTFVDDLPFPDATEDVKKNCFHHEGTGSVVLQATAKTRLFRLLNGLSTPTLYSSLDDISPMHILAYHGRTTAMQFCVDNSEDVVKKIGDECLAIAAREGHLRAVQLLLDLGAKNTYITLKDVASKVVLKELTKPRFPKVDLPHRFGAVFSLPAAHGTTSALFTPDIRGNTPPPPSAPRRGYFA